MTSPAKIGMVLGLIIMFAVLAVIDLFAAVIGLIPVIGDVASGVSEVILEALQILLLFIIILVEEIVP